jgi:hypothetical protein
MLMAAGAVQSRRDGIIAGESGVPGSWVGWVLLAGFTSLSGLVTGVGAVAAAMRPTSPWAMCWAVAYPIPRLSLLLTFSTATDFQFAAREP